MENTPSPGSRPPGRQLRVWPIVRQSFAVLFRHVVPFVLLAGGVGWTVGMVLFLTGLAPFLVLGRLGLGNLDFATLYFRQIASVTLKAASRVAVEAVIATALWMEWGGRRLTLLGSLRAVARAIPGVLHRPFYLFISRVCGVAILRAVLYLPFHAALVLLLTSESRTEPGAAWLILPFAGALVDTLIDSRLLMLLPVAAIERTGIVDSFRRCWKLTSGHWARIFGILLLIGCFPAALNWSVTTLFKRATGHLARHDLTVLATAAVFLKGGLIRALWAVVAVVCYRHVRVANGEIAAEQAVVSPPA